MNAFAACTIIVLLAAAVWAFRAHKRGELSGYVEAIRDRIGRNRPR